MNDIVFELQENGLLDNSLHHYLNGLVIADLEERLKHTDGLNKILLIDALLKLHNDWQNKDAARIIELRSQQARLKARFRSKLRRERKSIIKQWQ